MFVGLIAASVLLPCWAGSLYLSYSSDLRSDVCLSSLFVPSVCLYLSSACLGLSSDCFFNFLSTLTLCLSTLPLCLSTLPLAGGLSPPTASSHNYIGNPCWGCASRP